MIGRRASSRASRSSCASDWTNSNAFWRWWARKPAMSSRPPSVKEIRLIRRSASSSCRSTKPCLTSCSTLRPVAPVRPPGDRPAGLTSAPRPGNGPGCPAAAGRPWPAPQPAAASADRGSLRRRSGRLRSSPTVPTRRASDDARPPKNCGTAVQSHREMSLYGSAGSVDRPLDGVAVVVDDDHRRRQAVPDHGAEFLDGHLRRSVADQQDAPATGFGQAHTEQRRQRVADRRPQRLPDERHAVRQSMGTHPVEAGALIGEHDVTRA